jgi:hypothetical protein
MNAVSKPSKLKAVTPTVAKPTKPKILVSGKPGVGKTWGALDFPCAYVIDTEGGANLPHYVEKLERSGGVYMGPEQGSTSFDEVMGQVYALATEKHPYKTLVIDSISKLFAIEIAREAERLIEKNQKNEFGADKKPAVSYMRRLVSWLVRLDMNVVLVAHEKATWVRTGSQLEEGPPTFDAWDKLEYELHLWLQIIKQGNSRLAKIRKTRLTGFPDAETFPWSYEEFSTRYGKDIIEQAAAPLQLATEDQVHEVTRLLEIVKLPDGTMNKWFEKANVSTIQEMDAEKVDAILAHLRKLKETI